MKKRNILLSGVLAATVLTGCGNNKAEEKTKITFWHAMNGAQEETLKELTKEYEHNHPNVDVVLQNQSDYKTLNSKLTAAKQSASTLPNITQAYGDWLENDIKDNMLVDLTDKVNTNEYVQSFLGGVEYNKKLYGLPFAKSTEVLVYNKTVVDQLGLELPTTYDEYLQFCQIITDKTDMVGGGFDHLGNTYQTYLYNNGEVLNKEFDIESKASKQAAEYIQKGYESGAFRKTADTYLSNEFGQEKVASYIGTNGGLAYAKKAVGDKFEWAVAPYPADKSIAQGTDLFVYDKDKEVNKVAVDYIKFLTSKDSQIQWAINTGYIPVNKEALDSKEYQAYEFADVLKQANERTYSMPLNNKRNSLYLKSLKYIDEIKNGKNIDDVLKAFEQEKEHIFKGE